MAPGLLNAFLLNHGRDITSLTPSFAIVSLIAEHSFYRPAYTLLLRGLLLQAHGKTVIEHQHREGTVC